MATIFRPSPDELTAELGVLRVALQGAGVAAIDLKKANIAEALVNQSCASGDDPRPNVAHGGNCSFCQKGPHSLLRTPAAVAGAKALHGELIASNAAFADRADGKMIGVLICRNEKNEEVELRAYSGPGNAIVNSRNDWCATGLAPEIVSFNGNDRRAFVDADVIDNPRGNCAAQKLLHHAAAYARLEYAKRKSELDIALEEAKDDVPNASDYAKTKDDVLAKRLDILPESAEKARWSNVLSGNIDAADAEKAAARQEAVAALVAHRLKEDEDDEFSALRKVRAVEDKLRQLDANPPRLIPTGLAEIWIGAEKGGFPEKRNGEIIDSCYTCHNTVGDALCGLKELQEAHEHTYPGSIPKA